MLEHQHCQNPNYDTISPAGCLPWGAALQVTQLHSTGACGVSCCSQIHNTLRLCETSLFISHLLPGTCERPRVSPSPLLLPTPPFLHSHCLPWQTSDIFGTEGKEGRERTTRLCFGPLPLNEKERAAVDVPLGIGWSILLSNPRVPVEELSSEARQLLLYLGRASPPVLSISCGRKSFLGCFIKKKEHKTTKNHLISWSLPLCLTSFFLFSLFFSICF